MPAKQHILNHWLIWILRVSVFCCFVAHGTLAIKSSGNYGSEWSNWVQQLFPSDLKYSGSRIFLTIVGTIDILSGLCFLLPKIPKIAFAWTIVWGFLTAFSRIYFLGTFRGAFWSDQVTPLSEFLIRIPNGLIPLILYVCLCSNKIFGVTLNVWIRRWILLAFMSLVLALCFMYLAKWNGPFYPYEILKFYMPLWYFHFSGILAAASLGMLFIGFWYRTSKLIWRMAFILGAAAYIMVEGFDVFGINAPLGFMFTFIRVVEHVPVYVVISLATRDAWMCSKR